MSVNMYIAAFGDVRMKVSKDQVADNRRRVIESAARLFRQRGLDAVTLDDVMKDAGLTRGAFYGHFKSKDDLVVQAMDFAVKPANSLEASSFEEYVTRYLSTAHRDKRSAGCAYAALASEVTRQPAAIRKAMTDGLKNSIDLLVVTSTGDTPQERRRSAIAAISSMVGGLILARMSDDESLSDELLAGNAEMLLNKVPAPASQL